MTEQLIVLKDEERQPCEVWTRVMGYFRPVGHFNIGKKSEYDARKWFKEERIQSHAQMCEKSCNVICEKLSA